MALYKFLDWIGSERLFQTPFIYFLSHFKNEGIFEGNPLGGQFFYDILFHSNIKRINRLTKNFNTLFNLILRKGSEVERETEDKPHSSILLRFTAERFWE